VSAFVRINVFINTAAI